MKKILMISIRSDIGGGPKHLFDLARTLKSSHRFEELNISIAAPSEGFYGEKFQDISEHYFNIPHRRFSLITFLKLLLFIKSHHYTIVHSHGRGAGIYSRLMGLFGIKVVHTFHGVHFKENHFLSAIKIQVDRILSHITDQFICVSEEEKKLALKLRLSPSHKTHVVLNGIDTEMFLKTAKQNLAHHKEKPFLYFGYLARFNYQKGLDILVDYISQFRSQNPDKNFCLMVAGKGEEFQQIEKRIQDQSLQDKIYLVGETTDPAHFLGSVDWYISFARWEGLPLSVLEAMASLKPCFLSNVVGNCDLGKNGEALFFDLNNYQDFESKFLAILDGRINSQELVDKALSMVQQKHSLAQMASETYLLY